MNAHPRIQPGPNGSTSGSGTSKTTLSTALEGDPGAAAMMQGATNGFATPASPNWTAVESNNPIKAYLTKVLTGTDPNAAGKEANDSLTKTLNTKS